MSRPTVLVVGSVNVDLVVSLPVLPGPGETVTGGTHREVQGGKGANQAVAAARLGAATHLIARVGGDDAGRGAVDALRHDGVGSAHVMSTPEARTGLAAVLVDEASENLIGVSSGANHLLTPDDLQAAVEELALTDAVLVTCLEVPGDTVLAAARAARRRGWPVVLNPAPAQVLADDLLREVSVLTPNAHEVGALGAAGPADLLARGVGAVVTTLGSRGASIARAGHAPVDVPGTPVAAVDTTGAGDTFTGALATALARGEELVAAVHNGGTAAALSTLGHGARAAMPRHEDVVATLNGVPAPS
ncbi:ribokinase [Pseudonocardia sichuanensis]